MLTARFKKEGIGVTDQGTLVLAVEDSNLILFV
jgi:hypothetical protein